MVSTKPPSGMRDYLPDAVVKRRYVLGKVESVFQRYGFLPLETPTMEHLATLLGKYGDEGDQLLYRVLHRGERLSRVLTQDKVEMADLAELGLRYDLTVPLARVVAQYGHQLPRFFKRYQIQPVWRADRPAKGRFREFYQCDVDITGTTSLLAEAEVVNAIGQALEETALVAIDKLDKIGPAGVQDELAARGIAPAAAQRLLDLTTVAQDKDNLQTLHALREMIPLPQAQQALADLETLCTLTSAAPAGGRLRIAPALARGLSYYTGPIFEVVSADFSGSLGGGGRYDHLVRI